jgi:hypothetical protein
VNVIDLKAAHFFKLSFNLGLFKPGVVSDHTNPKAG